MKKLLSIIIMFTMLFSFAACGGNANNGESSSPIQQSSELNSTAAVKTENQSTSSETPAFESEPVETGSKSLVVYFSWSGNTENVAKAIQEQTDSDIFEIIPATPYSDDYNSVVDLAQKEQRENARPSIADSIKNIADYDVIYIGFPNWWGDMPMILYTFFDSYDLSGKTIAPFCTSGGSGLSNTVNEMKELEPNATVTDGLHIGSSSASNPDSAVKTWLSTINLVK